MSTRRACRTDRTNSLLGFGHGVAGHGSGLGRTPSLPLSFELNCSRNSGIKGWSMRWLISHRARLAAALVPLALSATLSWSGLLAAQTPIVDPAALPKFPPVAARDALNTFQIREGFRLELVAAEPLVTDPIALAFDEDGRPFVVEMTDYPEGDEPHTGHI